MLGVPKVPVMFEKLITAVGPDATNEYQTSSAGDAISAVPVPQSMIET
jgi:hypothetical protein